MIRAASLSENAHHPTMLLASIPQGLMVAGHGSTQ